MQMDDRLACLGGLLIVLSAPISMFLVMRRTAGARESGVKALWLCSVPLAIAPPITSWLCELLYWHFGLAGVGVAFVVVAPSMAALAMLSARRTFCESDLPCRVSYADFPLKIASALFALTIMAQLACISLGWNVISLPALKPETFPGMASHILTAFLPLTLFYTCLARFVLLRPGERAPLPSP